MSKQEIPLPNERRAEELAVKLRAVFNRKYESGEEAWRAVAEAAIGEADGPTPTRDAVEMFNFFQALTEWSKATFGDRDFRGSAGPLEHLIKEAEEAFTEADPHKRRVEIVDCLFLVFDAAWREGMTYGELARECFAKLAINRVRKWGKPKPSGASEHIREGEAAEMIDPASIEVETFESKIARKAYEAYCNSSGWKSLVSGAVLPPWSGLSEDIRKAWAAASGAAATEVRRAIAGIGKDFRAVDTPTRSGINTLQIVEEFPGMNLPPSVPWVRHVGGKVFPKYKTAEFVNKDKAVSVYPSEDCTVWEVRDILQHSKDLIGQVTTRLELVCLLRQNGFNIPDHVLADSDKAK